MPDQRLGRLLAAVLPRRIADDAFEPAWADLHIAHLRRRDRRGGLGKLAAAIRYALAGSARRAGGSGHDARRPVEELGEDSA